MTAHKTTGPVLPDWHLTQQRLLQASQDSNYGKRVKNDGLGDTPRSASSSKRMSTNPRRLRDRTPALSPRARKTVFSGSAFKSTSGPMMSSPRKVTTISKAPLGPHATRPKPGASTSRSSAGPGPHKAARKSQSMPVTDDEWSSDDSEEEEATSESDSDNSSRPPIVVEEDPHPNLSDCYVTDSEEGPEKEDQSGQPEEDDTTTTPAAARKEVVERTAQLPPILIPLPQLQHQEDVKPNIVPHPKLLSALEAVLALEYDGVLPSIHSKKPRLSFLRRSLRRGFQHRCEMLGIPTKADSKSVSLRVQYQHVPDVPIFKESLQAWLCPVCWLHGGRGFATRMMLEKHLEWDHPSLFCEWEDLGTNERVTTWKLSVLIPEVPRPTPPRQSLPPIVTLPTLPLDDAAGRDTPASPSENPEPAAHGGDTSIFPFVTLSPSTSPPRLTPASIPPTSASPQPSAPSPLSTATGDGDPLAMDVDSPPESTDAGTLRSASEASMATLTTGTTPTLASESRESTLSVPPTEESDRRSSSTDTDMYTPSRQSTATPIPETLSSRPKRATALRQVANRNVRFEPDREDSQPSRMSRSTSATATPSESPFASGPTYSPTPAPSSFTPPPIIPPPRDDPLGPAARRPYLPAEPDYEGGTTLYYSTRVGGECLFDLLKTLPRERFGVLVWEVLDREEEIYECSDMADEFKVMHALWARWIMLNQSLFIESYRKGARAFVDEYWRFIHRAAGWDALRYWLVTLLANRFLTAEDVALTLKHYESLTGMDDWYPDG